MESRGGFPRKGGLRWSWREPGQVSGQEDGSRQRPLKVPKEGCLAGWFWRLMGDPQPPSVGLGLSPCFSASLNNWKEIWETSLTTSVWSLRKQKSCWLLEKTIQEAHEKGSPDSLLCDMEKMIPYATEGVEGAENWANSPLLFCWLQGPFITRLSADSIQLESVAPPKMLPNSKPRFKEMSRQSQTWKKSSEMGQTPILKQSVFPMKLLFVLVLTLGHS